MSHPLSPGLSLCIVLSANQQTGGGYHQSMSNLVRILQAVPEGASVSVLDAKRSFTEGLNGLITEGKLNRSQVIELPSSLPSFSDKVVADNRLPYRFARAILSLDGREVKMSPLARYLDRSAFDLVFFASPAPEAAELQVKPFIWTLWDLCHLDSPEFPEVRTWGKFEAREQFFSRALRKAALVLADSQDLVEKAQLYYGVNSEKFVIIPFQAPNAVTIETTDERHLPKPIRHLSGMYYFYPAQLWTHKNHARIIEALHLVNSRGYDHHVVFVGKDHGAGSRLKKKVSDLNLEDRIHFLGYVEDQAISALYAHSIALIMASYFGPTNLPPLEALTLGVPVIASSIHSNQLGDSALYFDPDDAKELAEHMLSLSQEKTRISLVKSGAKHLRLIEKAASTGLHDLSGALHNLTRRLVE